MFGRCMRCFERCLGAFRIWFGTSLRDVWEVLGCIEGVLVGVWDVFGRCLGGV